MFQQPRIDSVEAALLALNPLEEDMRICPVIRRAADEVPHIDFRGKKTALAKDVFKALVDMKYITPQQNRYPAEYLLNDTGREASIAAATLAKK